MNCDNGSKSETPSEALRAVALELTALGVTDAQERLRAGAAAMARRALAAYRTGGKGPGWLARVIEDGGSLLPAPEPVDELEASRIRAFDGLYREASGEEWRTA